MSQDLIERVRRGERPSHSLAPNRISRSISKQKARESITPFVYSRLKNLSEDADITLDVHQKQYDRLIDQSGPIELLIPVDVSRALSLTLERRQILSRGQVRSLATYQGYVTDDQSTVAAMTVSAEELSISISDVSGTYRVARPRGSNVYILYKDDNIDPTKMLCGTTDDGSMDLGYRPTNSSTVKGDRQKTNGDIVEVYVECDYQLYQDKGSVNAVESYVATLFNEVSTLFANEEITLRVSDIKVWTTPDPYRSTPLDTVEKLLYDFGDEVMDNYDGRLAALISGRVPSGSGVGGIAWVDVLCKSYLGPGARGPYSFNYGFGRYAIREVPQYSLDVSIITHELGHNFGSPHTHDCVWGPNGNQRIDNCIPTNCSLVSSPEPNTIMSYCGNVDFELGFGTLPGNLIRSRYQSATCLVSGGSSNEPCTHSTANYTNTTFGDGIAIKAKSDINLWSTSRISSGADVEFQAERSTNVYGTLEVPSSSILTIIADMCDN